MPLAKDRYLGMRLSSNSSLMKTRLTNSLMFFGFFMPSCKHTGVSSSACWSIMCRRVAELVYRC